MNYSLPISIQSENVGGSHSWPSDEIRATSSGSCTILLQANGVCFLHQVVGDFFCKYVRSSHVSHTNVTCEGYKVRCSPGYLLVRVYRVFVFADFCGVDFPDPLPIRVDFDKRSRFISNYEMVVCQRCNRRPWPEGRILPGWRIGIQGPDLPDS